MKKSRSLAGQGVSTAQYNLGVMYDKGQGVPQDNAMAHLWFNIGAANGNQSGTEYRNKIAKKKTSLKPKLWLENVSTVVIKSVGTED